LEELGITYEQWKESKIYDLKCTNCKEKNYVFKCAICLKNGLYLEEETSTSRKKKSSRNKKEET
jgi:hypothetical protein